VGPVHALHSACRHRKPLLALNLASRQDTGQNFSDLEIAPDGFVIKSCTIARLDDLPAGGGIATSLAAWQLGDLDGKPEGLAFTAQGRAIVGLDICAKESP